MYRPNVKYIPSVTFSLVFILLLAGDVELNPGPTTRSNVPKDMDSDDQEIFMEASSGISESPNIPEAVTTNSSILDFLSDLKEGQKLILDNQQLILSRIDKLESDFVRVRDDVRDLQVRHDAAEITSVQMKDDIFTNKCRVQDLVFLLD